MNYAWEKGYYAYDEGYECGYSIKALSKKKMKIFKETNATRVVKIFLIIILALFVGVPASFYLMNTASTLLALIGLMLLCITTVISATYIKGKIDEIS